LTAELRGLGFACVDSQANFVWCRHATADSRGLYEKLKAVGILVRYMNYAGWGDGLRISIGTDEQTDVLLAKLGELI
jgi:histidinol-phosphate aminotransferase